MDSDSPSSDIIPAVAARLKYYFDVERKEAGFDLSSNPRDPNEKYRLYELAGNHALPQTQRIKIHCLENQMEAAIRNFTGKCESGQDKKQTEKEKTKQVQRKIKKNMSVLTMPDFLLNNRVCLDSINLKSSDHEGFSLNRSHGNPAGISHGEFKRLVASAADLIVASTPHIQFKEVGSKTGVGHSCPSTCNRKSDSLQEHLSSTETSCLDEKTHGDEKVVCDLKVLHSLPNGSLKQEAEKSNIAEYEIRVHTEAVSPPEDKPSLLLRLMGDHGRSKTILLQNTMLSSSTACAGQVVSNHVKSRDVGKLKQVLIGVSGKYQGCRCYCTNISILKGATEYMFPCNQWLSHQVVSVSATDSDTSSNQSEERGSENLKPQSEEACRTGDGIEKDDKDNTSSLATSEVVDLNPYASEEKATLPQKGEAKEMVVSQISNPTTELSNKKAKTKELKEIQMSKAKPVRTLKTSKGKSAKTMVKKEVPLDKNLNKLPDSEEESTVVSSGNPNVKDGKLTNQVSKNEVIASNARTNDGNMAEAVLDNNCPDKDFHIDSKKHPDELSKAKHRRAGSPASYVFFAHESKPSPLLADVTNNSKRNSSSPNHNSKDSNVEPPEDRMDRPGCPSPGNSKDGREDGASGLHLLQQILTESEDNLKDGSPRAISKFFTDNLNSQENRVHHDEDLQSNDIHTLVSDYASSSYPPESEGVATAGYYCLCENCCNYESDSTLNEEYLFSDSSLALSFSEDEERELYSKSPSQVKDTKEFPQKVNTAVQDLRDTNNHRILPENRGDSCSRKSDTFLTALKAIQSVDVKNMKHLCQSHFFLTSVTDDEGKTLLHHAAAEEEPVICQVLLDTTVGRINIDQHDLFGKTALHYAAENGNIKTLKLLLERGAKLEIPDENSNVIYDIIRYCSEEDLKHTSEF
ncbi:uncharacterized protein [Hyperolius riggenbachi]|uniref:uncharacterized protein isoform X3 n=1 Tax=Hyperolius riggenbachi TaxID=752182 RepID=UPI0035A2B0F0